MTEPERPAHPVSLPPIRSALTAPFAVALRELREVGSRPGPLIGGLFGSSLGCAALAAALLWMPSPAAAETEDFVVEFVPASMIAAGELDEPLEQASEAPEAPSEAPEPDSEVSEAERPAPEPEPEPKPTPHSNPQPNPTPNPNPSPSGPDNPFVDPGAWSELIADGDPWAAAVMRALRSMQVPAWGGKISASNPYRFRLRICKDGRVDKVLRKRSTGDASLDATLAHELGRVDLPAIPSSIAAGMDRGCMILGYEFEWAPSGVH